MVLYIEVLRDLYLLLLNIQVKRNLVVLFDGQNDRRCLHNVTLQRIVMQWEIKNNYNNQNPFLLYLINQFEDELKQVMLYNVD